MDVLANVGGASEVCSVDHSKSQKRVGLAVGRSHFGSGSHGGLVVMVDGRKGWGDGKVEYLVGKGRDDELSVDSR